MRNGADALEGFARLFDIPGPAVVSTVSSSAASSRAPMVAAAPR